MLLLCTQTVASEPVLSSPVFSTFSLRTLLLFAATSLKEMSFELLPRAGFFTRVIRKLHMGDHHIWVPDEDAG